MKFLSSEKLSPHKYKTPEGYLICTDAILARTGKQTYRKNEIFSDTDDDSEIEVDRTSEEVFSSVTLASFENKPITVEHPDEDVNAGNHNELSVGFVRDVHKGEINGQDVMLGTLVITDAKTIEEIENGEHTDLSCGYDCDIIDEANPQQRNIRGNHVALCQQGRAGIARIVDSIKDSSYVSKDKSEIINILNTWSDNPKESIDIIMPGGKFIRIFKDKFNNKYTAWTSKLTKKEFDKAGKAVDYIVLMGLNELLNDSVKDTEYRIVNYNNNWYYEIKQEDGFTKLVGPYNSKEEAKKYFMKHRPNEKLKDSHTEELAQKEYDKFKEEIKRIESEIDRNDNNPRYDMKEANDKLKDLQNKINKLKQQFNVILTDELIQSGSEEAFNKNIATEIRSGKDPKQAAAIAYSIKRKNDSKKYEVSYIEDSIEHIYVVRANSLSDAIKKLKMN